VVAAPSCDVLEVGEEAVLVPLVTDAVVRVDVEARVIEVDLRFLGIGPGATGAS
jgi:ribosomal 30S subunit maturation factor RimM